MILSFQFRDLHVNDNSQLWYGMCHYTARRRPYKFLTTFEVKLDTSNSRWRGLVGSSRIPHLKTLSDTSRYTNKVFPVPHKTHAVLIRALDLYSGTLTLSTLRL
jgi:hypothetical protein